MFFSRVPDLFPFTQLFFFPHIFSSHFLSFTSPFYQILFAQQLCFCLSYFLSSSFPSQSYHLTNYQSTLNHYKMIQL